MHALYITSMEPFSGKTAFCLAIGRKLRSQLKLVGYLKPLSTQPRAPTTARGQVLAGRMLDEDAEFVARALELSEAPDTLAPVVVTRELLERSLHGTLDRVLLNEIAAAFHVAAKDKDVMLLEGGASLREGYALNLSTPLMARQFDARALSIVRWDGSEMRALDDALTAQFRLGEALLGVVYNAVPEGAYAWVETEARTLLERRGVRLFGVIPQEARLMAMSVGEIALALDARFLALPDNRYHLAETLAVGAMTAEVALPRFQRQRNKAVITGGDRTDILFAALETSTRCLVLTGNLEPDPRVLARAIELNVPVLLARQGTLEAIEAIEQIFGKTRLGQPEKLARFESLMNTHFDYTRLFDALGVTP